MKKNSKKYLMYLMIAFIVGIVAILGSLFWINRTTPGAYDFGACTFNKYDCNITYPDWNGECTDEIEDECCMSIRMCSGQIVQNPMDCYDKYCLSDGHMCIPMEEIAGSSYKCTCKDLDDYI